MKKITYLSVLVIVLFSFSGKDNNVYKGFNLKSFEKSLSLIPGGWCEYGRCHQIEGGGGCDYLHKHIKIDRYKTDKSKYRDSLATFYISNHEVSNGEYLEFINDIKKIDSLLYKQLLPDTLVWRAKNAYNEPYVEYYLRHPSYSNFPVVGITYEQAEQYCKWLTQKYMHEEKRKYKNIEFKLPTIFQWKRSVSGDKDEPHRFPFEGLYLSDSNGNLKANFKILNYDFLYYNNTALNDHADITVPVISYSSGYFGLYNMAGNVEEYVKEKGITKGGSWNDVAAYLYNTSEEYYDSTNYTSAERGFRFIMEIKK